MDVQVYVVGPLQTNCYIVSDPATGEALVIDPGDMGRALVEAVEERGLRVTGVFATHHHTDHTAAVPEVLEAAPDARFCMSAEDYPRIAEMAGMAQQLYGRPIEPPRAPDRLLAHGDTLPVGEGSLTVLHCPGHTPGSLCLVGDGRVFTGDVLFQGSIGRSDFPGGNGLQLLQSIHEHLLTLPGETEVLPGHGMLSTIAAERERNPFLQAPPEEMAARFGL